MSEKDYQKLMELAREHLYEKVSKEEALRSLIACGLVDKNGDLIFPEIAPYLAAIPDIPSISDGTCTI